MTVGQVQRSNLFPIVGARFAAAKQTKEEAAERLKASPTESNKTAERGAFEEYIQAKRAAQNLSKNYANPPSAIFSEKYDDYLNYPANPAKGPPPNPRATKAAHMEFLSKAYQASIYAASLLPPGSRMPPLGRERALELQGFLETAAKNTAEQRMQSARALSAAGLAEKRTMWLLPFRGEGNDPAY